jgi:hypothetical protein
MISYCALAILAVLLGANAQGDPSCSKQMELEHRCMMNVETSPEAQMIKDRMKQAKKTCVPDYPQECHAQFEAGHECAMSIAKNADSDPTFQASKSQSQPAIDACFDKYPVDIKKGVMEIFMMGKPGMHKGGHKKWNHHKKHHNDTSSSASASDEKHSGEAGSASSSESNSNETSAERHHGGGGKHHGGGGHGGGGKHHGGGGGHGGRGHHCRPHRHGKHGGHGPRNFTSGESNSNETSSSASRESGGKSGGRSGGRSGEKSGEKPQCRKTEEQKQCIKDEMKKLAKDAAFVDVINTLIHQKQKCKQTVTWSCSAKCPKKRKCIWKASKPCREAFMGKMKTCLADKGFTLPPFMLREHTDMFTTPSPDVTPIIN